MSKRYLKNFCFNGLMLQVESPDKSHLIWLEEFLCPQFEVIDRTSSYHCKVRLIIDDNRYKHLRKIGSIKNNQTIDAFAFDSRMIRLPILKSNENSLCIYHKKEKVFYTINSDRTKVQIISPKKNKAVRKAAMRVIREFVMNHSHRRGDLIIHGAAFSVGNKGVILAGPKGSGKTTLLLHVLLQSKSSFVGNDRVLVNYDTKGPVLHGVPTIISIKPKTLGYFQGYFRTPIPGLNKYHLTLNETKSETNQFPKTSILAPLSISPTQFCRLVQVKSQASASLKAIVFTKITSRIGKIRLRELSPNTSARRVRDCLFRADFIRLKSSVFDLAIDNKYLDRETLVEKCQRLSSHIRFFECRLGPKAYKDESLAKELIEFVLK